MSQSDLIELRMKPVGPFYSPFDETAFFEWLDKIKCITKYEGRGDTLFIYVRVPDLDQTEMRELLSVFHRYDVDMKQLAVFDRDDFADWFRNKSAYWYKPIFGSKPRKSKTES